MNATLNHVFMQVCGVGVFIFFLFTVLVSSNSSGTTGEDSWKSFELCLPKDYRIASWSSCVDNQRTVIYERSQGSCTGVLSFESKIPCECQLEDYEPILEDPECGESETLSAPITAIKGWRPRVGAGCSPNIAVERSLNSTVTNAEGSVSVNCPCTEKHIGIYTTDCDAQNSSRTVIYYWNRPCSPIYIQLPSPKFISCEFTCGDGYYFNAAQGVCYTCPAGTYSGSGLMYTAPWNSLPSTFSTECEGVGCSSWMTQGDYMFSGSNFNLKNIRSTLNFMFEVSRPSAVLSITYRVSSERNRDLFKIKIRGKTALVDSGVSASWKTFNATIEDYADICPWNIKWTRYGQTYEYCLLRTKITPPSSRLVAALQENSRAFHYDHILIPEQSGCEWPMYERPMKWKAGDRVLVFVPVGGCSIEKKISFAQRAKMDAVVIVTEQFAHQVDILTDPEILQEFPLFILNLDMTVFLDAISRSDRPWFNYKKVPPLGPIQVELLYEKDDSASLGADHVLIKEIQVDAPKDALGSYKCFACPPGTSSVEGSSSCVACPVNTYSADYQSSACTPCPDGYISESGSTECAPVHDCALDDFFPIEESGCHLSKSSTRSLERVVTYQPVEPIRCNDPDKALRTLSPKTFQCASCPEGFILNSSGVCTPCLNGMGTSPEGDRCIQCPSNKAIYPVSSYVEFSALGGSFPPSWTTSCDFCNTVGWRFVPYYQNVNLGQSVGNVATGIGVGGSFFTEGKAVLEVPFELSNFGDLFFTYSYSESSEEGSVVTFQIVNPTEQTPGLSIIAIEENPSGASTYASSKLRPGQYVARWTYFKDIKPSHQKSSSPVNVTLPSLSSFIIRTLTFRGDRNGTGTCQECLVGHSCEAGLLKPCLAGTYSGVETEYKCIPCPEKSISEIGDARCRACPLGSKPSADRRVCELFESNVSYPHGRHQYVWSYTPAVFGPVHLDLDHDASPHSPSADRESEQTLFVLNSYNSTEFRDVAARFPLDFNTEVYGPSVYVISSDNVMRIGNLKSMQVVEKIGSNTTNYVFDNATGNVTLPVTDLHFESDFPCEADHSLHVSANVFYHCNITHSRPWISASNYEPNKCLYNIHVHFQQACPQCFNIYAVRSTSECVNGMHDVYKKYVAKDTNACYDERVMAPGVYLTEFCTLSDQIETRSGLISIVALVTTILCAVILFFALFIYRKHRKLYETYQSLTTRGAPRDGYHIDDDEIKEMNAHIPRGVVID